MARSKGDGRGGRVNGEAIRVGHVKVVGRRLVAVAGGDTSGNPVRKRDAKRHAARGARRAGEAEALAGLGEGATSPDRTGLDSDLARERRVLVMADFGAEGVWDARGSLASASDLPVDDDLRRRLVDWSARFRLCEPDDPGPGDFAPTEAEAHASEGRALAAEVAAALPGWVVTYRSAGVTETMGRGRRDAGAETPGEEGEGPPWAG